MHILALFWFLIFILIVHIVLYEPLKPIDIFFSDDNDGKGANMTVESAKLIKTIRIPKNTRKLEVVIYNTTASNVLMCTVLQGGTAIGKKGVIAKEGFSSLMIDIQRGFDATAECVLSIENTDGTTLPVQAIKLKSIKAWVA